MTVKEGIVKAHDLCHTLQACEPEPGNYVRTYLNIVTHNKGNASIGVKMYGEDFRFLAHSFVRLGTKNVILHQGCEHRQKVIASIKAQTPQEPIADCDSIHSSSI